jgi:hypothetical protein
VLFIGCDLVHVEDTALQKEAVVGAQLAEASQ